MYDAYIGRRFRRMKITRKTSDVAENLQLYCCLLAWKNFTRQCWWHWNL